MKRSFMLQERGRRAFASDAITFWFCLRRAKSLGVLCDCARAMSPEKPHFKAKACSIKPDWARSSCSARGTQINTCWELVFYGDNLRLCMPASKNTPPQGAREPKNIPAAWGSESSGGKAEEEARNQRVFREFFLFFTLYSESEDVLSRQVLQLNVSSKTRGSVYVTLYNQRQSAMFYLKGSARGSAVSL